MINDKYLNCNKSTALYLYSPLHFMEDRYTYIYTHTHMCVRVCVYIKNIYRLFHYMEFKMS